MSENEANAEECFRALLGDYQVASATAVAAELGILDALGDGPRSLEELVQISGAHPRSLFRLLRALASVGMLARGDDGAYLATPLTSLLATAAPDAASIQALWGGLPHEREAWVNLRHSILTGQSAFRQVHGESSWEYHERHPALGAALHQGMARGTKQWAGTVLAAYSFAGASCVVDVGGGRGALLAVILGAYPPLRGILFDRPAVVRDAPPLFEEAGVADRVAIASGDFLQDVPPGGDLYLLKSILHNWGDDAARRILQNCRTAIPPEGRLVLVEPVLDLDNPNQREMFFMDLHMLAIHGSAERTAAEFSALLASTGYRLIRIIPTGMMGSVIEAVPGGQTS